MKNDIRPATLEDFAYWINERHQIYLRKQKGDPKPWSDDPIFQQWKFTNVYRQLDTGTIWLTDMLKTKSTPELIVFNVIWYRLFNWWEHARDLGFVNCYEAVENYITECHKSHKKIFTSSHYQASYAIQQPEGAWFHYLRACKEAWNQRSFIAGLSYFDSMKVLFHKLKQIYLIGDFFAYEIVCDLRFALNLELDKLTWANVGPGAERGLKRLGMLSKLTSMRLLFDTAKDYLKPHVFECEWPFEFREIEHSLCEFDKYQRIKTGVGHPRQRYPGEAE
jgi:hypothetical protein